MALFRCSNPAVFDTVYMPRYDTNPHNNTVAVPIECLKGFTKATITVTVGTSTEIHVKDSLSDAQSGPTVSPGSTVDISGYTTGFSVRTYGQASYMIKFHN